MQKQSQRRQIDKQQNIRLLAKFCAKLYGGDQNTYSDNHQLMDQKIKADKNFPWQEIASQLNLDRWRLYHWYYETFQRMLAGSIERDDVQIMRTMIKEALSKDQPLDKPFQQQVKEALKKEYHRSSFSIAFNNTKRQIMKELGKTEIPQPRQIIHVQQQQVQILISQQLRQKSLQQQQNTQAKTEIIQQQNQFQQTPITQVVTQKTVNFKQEPSVIQQSTVKIEQHGALASSQVSTRSNIEDVRSQSFDSAEDEDMSQSSFAENCFITSCLDDEPDQLVDCKIWTYDSIQSDQENDNIYMELKDNYYDWSFE